MNIFVVDDDPNVIDLLSAILADGGFHNLRCSLSSTEGLSVLKKQNISFDCLIFDIDMPNMNGIELCQRVRRLPKYKEVPIIMLTALRDEETVQAAIDAGATDYITKPFDVLQIGIRVRMSERLAAAQRALKILQDADEYYEKDPFKENSNITRDEIMDIFAEELYRSKKA